MKKFSVDTMIAQRLFASKKKVENKECIPEIRAFTDSMFVVGCLIRKYGLYFLLFLVITEIYRFLN